MNIPVDSRIDIQDADAILFVSGPGIGKIHKDKTYLHRLNLNNLRQIMCSGALGLLEGKSATTYPSAKKELGKLYVHGIISFGQIWSNCSRLSS